MKEASRFFLGALDGSGHIVVQCGICNRTHFAADGGLGDWDEGELELLQKRAAEDPDTYIAHDGSGVHAVDVGAGTPAVIDCPCEGLARYEGWVWRMRERIIAYLKARTADDLARAASNAAALDSAPRGLHGK